MYSKTEGLTASELVSEYDYLIADAADIQAIEALDGGRWRIDGVEWIEGEPKLKVREWIEWIRSLLLLLKGSSSGGGVSTAVAGEEGWRRWEDWLVKTKPTIALVRITRRGIEKDVRDEEEVMAGED